MKMFQLMRAANHLLAVKSASDKQLQLVLKGSTHHSELFERVFQQLFLVAALLNAEKELQNLENSMLSRKPNIVLKDIMDFKSSFEIIKRNVEVLVPHVQFQRARNSPVSSMIIVVI